MNHLIPYLLLNYPNLTFLSEGFFEKNKLVPAIRS